MESFANIDMEDYWNEYRTIRGRRAEIRGSHSEDDSRSHDDDVDSDDTFLNAVLSDAFKTDRELNEAELSNSRLYDTLTHRQKEQVIRRAQARNNTLRQKRLKAKAGQKPDIWSLFATNDNSSTGTRSRSATPDSLDSISPPRTPPDPSPQNWVEPDLSRSRASLDSGHHSLITSSSTFAPISPPSSSISPHLLQPHSVSPSRSPKVGKKQEPTRRYSPPDATSEKYYYNLPDERLIYRAPSLDMLSSSRRREHQAPPTKKDNTVRRQSSYAKEIARDFNYTNKGVYEMMPKFVYDPDGADVQGLKYKQIGTIHIPKNKSKMSYDNHYFNQSNFEVSPTSIRRSHSIKHPPKDPFDRNTEIDPLSTTKDRSKDHKWEDRTQKENIENRARSSTSTDLGFKVIPNGKNPNYPDLLLEISRSGQTKIDWLHDNDIARLHSLCLLELDIIFSENNIHHSWRKRNKKRKSKDETGIFGVSLETLLEKDKRFLPDPFLETNIPLIIHKLFTHLELRGLREEGILRIPGHRAKTEELRRSLDTHFHSSPEEADQALRDGSPNELAALIKLFLRELPQPLLTLTYATAFYKTHKILDLGERVMALTMLILLLPKSYRDTLKGILDLSARVVTHERENKMGLYNVAMIMAPNIFLPSLQPKSKLHLLSDDKEQQLNHEVEYAKVTTQLVQVLIKYRDILWTVPHRLLAQIRRQCEASLRPSNSKPIHKLLSRKPKDLIQRPIANEVEYQNGVMRISAPQFNKVNYPVKLDWEMTSKDILIRFIEDQSHLQETPQRVVGRREQQRLTKKNSGPPPCDAAPMVTCLLRGSMKHALDNHALHEKSGNIGDRRIDHNAHLIAIYQDNPNGQFYIKCHHPGGQPEAK